MKLLTHIYLDLLGVGELVENLKTVVQDRLGLNKRRSHAELTGKTAVITGGNAGVGYATAEALLRRGAHVVLACRSAERGRAAAAQLAAACTGPGGVPAASSGSGNCSDRKRSADGHVAASAGAAPAGPPRVDVEELDLACLASVRRFVRRWAAGGRPLDLLVCNAGVMCPPCRLETGDGFELQFQSNFLSHFLLASSLARHQQLQRRAALRAGGGGGGGGQPRPLRVIFLSSMTHLGADLASDLADVPYCRRRWHSFQAYCNSKLCTLLAAKHMDRLFAGDALSAGGRDAAVAVHPGLVDTLLARGYFKQTAPPALRPLTDPFFDRFFCPYLLRTPEAAAETVLYAATAPAEEVGGRYCGTAPHVSRHSAAAADPALAQGVWDLAAHLCRLGPDEALA